MKRSRILAWSIGGIFLAAGVGTAVVVSRTPLAVKSDEVPLAVVKRGEIDLQVHATGELRASHSVVLAAPAIGGAALQITKLAQTGAQIKKGDTVIEFDPSEQHYKLEQSRSELEQAKQEIAKAKADAQVQAAEDKVALLKARYDVRSAELDVQKDELLSKLDADKNQLALQQARQVLAELEKDIESHKDSGKAATFLAREKYNKANLTMTEAQQNLQKMTVTAPMDGVISIQRNLDSVGGFFFTGMSIPDYHPGDQARPGRPIARVVDPMGMELVAKVGERNRGNIKQGQTVTIVFDALPDRTFQGTVKSIGGISRGQFFSASNSGSSFEVSIQISDPDALLRSGFTAKVVFMGDSKKNVLYLPQQAVFQKDGKRIVFVSKNGGYEQQEVTVLRESESRAEVEGLNEGTSVALIDPTVPRKSVASSVAGSVEGTL